MAIMECPNCGEQVSDKAKKCMHCGEILIPEEKRYCQECGIELEDGVDVCPKCGCPVENIENSETAPQQVEVTGVKIDGKSKKIIAIVAMALLMAALIAVSVVQGQKKKEAEDAAKRIKEYSSNLELVTYSMISGAGDAEKCGNLIKKVWYNAIYEERNDSTDKYTRPNGYFVSDFNDALQNLYSDSSFSLQVSGIEDNQDTVNTQMKKLKNPPDEYEDAYEAVTELYDAYLTLTNLAIDPTGSLQTFSSNFNNADSETVKCYDAIKMYLED
ncbi:hypothetical protein BHF70_02170 [Anaerostipes sp. 494a]|uniref:zinc-ribbon domain-containing protein n=1 Tax=Anaerostipes sp. 494a TaxID=1261636 RepID=UPI0009527A16|nr:zinc ribbon domain-containing protein [Anaerostipes sp. 494a]OLR58529.1 hypothetical protein BHF70_02170 [Anaerostipes sp. 494a]